MNHFEEKPMTYTGAMSAAFNKYSKANPNPLPVLRNEVVKKLNARQQKANEKAFLKEQERLLELEMEKERVRQERVLRAEQDRRELQRIALENERKRAQKKANYVAGAKKRAEAKKLLKQNIIADLNGTLQDFDTQISYPLQLSLGKLVGQTHAYLQISVNGATITSKLFEIQGGDGSAIWWNNIQHEFVVYVDGILVERIPVGSNFHVVIMKASEIPSQRIQQMFREGEVHCVIEPLYIMFKTMSEQSESDASKKRLAQIARKLKSMEAIYPNGVPENDMAIIGKICSRCIILHDIIGNEITRYNPSSTICVHFTNTRENHIDQGHLVMDKKYKFVSDKEMETIMNEHNKSGDFYLFDGDIKTGIANRIRSAKGAWCVEDSDRELFSEFSKSLGINNYGLNAIEYSEVNQFVKESRIINSTPVPLCEEPNQMNDVHHIDVEKAYTQHKYAPFYKGFLGHITNWRRLTNCDTTFITSHLGIYQFRVLSNPSELLKKLGLHNGKVYTLPSCEIEYFMSLGMTIRLLAGCWGSTFDMEYVPEMLENRRYCTWAGKLGSDHSYDVFTLKGGSQWASHLKSELGNDNVLYFSDEKMIVIKIAKKSYSTRHHILSFITSYTRLNMMKLMESVSGDLIKVVLDGLYYRGVLPDVEIPHHNDKELKQHIGFRDAWYYESKIDTSQWSDYDDRFDGSAVLCGAGGSGKTTTVFESKGLMKPLFVVPSHVLGRKMSTQYKCKYTTINRFIGMDCRAFKEDQYEPHVVLIDELTMIESSWIDKAIELYPNTMFLIAGDIDKKQWFQCRNGCPGKYSKIWIPTNMKYVYFTTDYRSKDEELKDFKVKVRQAMKDIFTDGEAMDNIRMKLWLQTNYKCHTFDEAVAQFTPGDTWIAGTHATNKKLLSRNVVSGFINSDKEIMKAESDSCEKRGSFTIHSYQGLKIDEGKVFISLDMFEYAMLYTAISRCVRFEQIVLVKA